MLSEQEKAEIEKIDEAIAPFLKELNEINSRAWEVRSEIDELEQELDEITKEEDAIRDKIVEAKKERDRLLLRFGAIPCPGQLPLFEEVS